MRCSKRSGRASRRSRRRIRGARRNLRGQGLNPRLARQVAEALTELDPAAAHADAELRLEALGPTSGTVLAALTAGLCFGIGAVILLAAMTWLPRGELLALTFVAILFALGLTGWFAAWLTGVPVIRLVRRNIVLGSAVMAAGILRAWPWIELPGSARGGRGRVGGWRRRHRELHIAGVILRHGEKYGIKLDLGRHDGRAPAGSSAQSAREHAFLLRVVPRSRMPGNPRLMSECVTQTGTSNRKQIRTERTWGMPTFRSGGAAWGPRSAPCSCF